ncbi:MAG TPA: PEGA domain-containing protein, partial [Polyangiaceae bacterium]
ELELQAAVQPLLGRDPRRGRKGDRIGMALGGTGTRPIASCVIGLLIGASLIAGGVAVLRRVHSTEDDVTMRSGGRLELSPERAGTLRIVVDPWASVTIDGQLVGTTPMARPIPLPAGSHFVRLEHPRAPIERRTVRLSPGETVLLDVKMNVAPSADPNPDPSANGPDAGWSP